MKLLHIADLHLGKKLHGYDLLEDQKAALLEILKIAEGGTVEHIPVAIPES